MSGTIYSLIHLCNIYSLHLSFAEDAPRSIINWCSNFSIFFLCFQKRVWLIKMYVCTGLGQFPQPRPLCLTFINDKEVGQKAKGPSGANRLRGCPHWTCANALSRPFTPTWCIPRARAKWEGSSPSKPLFQFWLSFIFMLKTLQLFNRDMLKRRNPIK